MDIWMNFHKEILLSFFIRFHEIDDFESIAIPCFWIRFDIFRQEFSKIWRYLSRIGHIRIDMTLWYCFAIYSSGTSKFSETSKMQLYYFRR